MTPEIFRHKIQGLGMAVLRRDGRLDVRDIRRAMEIPPGVHHNHVGLAFAELARKRVIQPLGHTRSDWHGGNGHHITVWALGPRAADWRESATGPLPEIQADLFKEGGA